MNSIRQRLSYGLSIALAGILAFGLGAIYARVRAELYSSFDEALLTRARAISTLIVLNGSQLSLQFSDKFLREFDDDVSTSAFELSDANGRLVQRSEGLSHDSFPRNVGTFDTPVFTSFRLQDGRRARALGVSFVPRGSTKQATRSNTQWMRLVVVSDKEALEASVTEILTATLLVGGLLIVITPLVVLKVIDRSMRPLSRLTSQLEQIDVASLCTRVSAHPMPIELKPIQETTDRLLDRLEQAFERERRVSSALAHELRTPIAELRSLAEVAIRWPKRRDAHTDQDVLAIAIHMEQIVTRMLALSRIESGQCPVSIEQVRIDTLTQQVVRALEARIKANGCRVEMEIAPTTIATDSVLLRAIVSNLLENAVDHCPKGSLVRVRVAAEQGRISWRVSNSAPDLTKDDLPRLGERFWRKDAARSSSVHTGLGLSIVKALTAAIDWDLAIALDDDQTVTFVIGQAL